MIIETVEKNLDIDKNIEALRLEAREKFLKNSTQNKYQKNLRHTSRPKKLTKRQTSTKQFSENEEEVEYSRLEHKNRMHLANNADWNNNKVSSEVYQRRRAAINMKFSVNDKMEKEADKVLNEEKLIEEIQDKYVNGQISVQQSIDQLLKLQINDDESLKVVDTVLGNLKLFKEIEAKYNKGEMTIEECIDKKKLKIQIETEKMKSLKWENYKKKEYKNKEDEVMVIELDKQADKVKKIKKKENKTTKEKKGN